MNAIAVSLFDEIKRLCIERGNEALWHLAVTHSSAQGPSAQVALSHLGNAGLELVIAWNHIRTQDKRDSGTVTRNIGAFTSSEHWVDSLICDETISIFATGKGLSLQSLSRLLKRQFIYAVLGACFCVDSVEGCKVVLTYLLRFSPGTKELGAANQKSPLQQYAQRLYRIAPAYSVISEDGPDHDKSFVAKAEIPGTRHSAQGRGKTKKIAEQDAARSLLHLLGVSTKTEYARPATSAHFGKLNGSDIAAWSPDKWADQRTKDRHPHHGTSRFVHFIKEHTGLQLPPEFAEIVVTHSSIVVTHSSPQSELARRCGPKENGLTVLGNRAYNYGIVVSILRDQDFVQLSEPDLQGRIASMVSTLGANEYKVRLARPWSVYIRTGPGVDRPLPESILLDAFEGSLGAAALLDLSNLDAITSYLREKLSTVADFATATVEAEFAREVRNIAKSQLQQLAQMCFPGEQLFCDSVFEFQMAGPCHAQQFTCRIVGERPNQFTGVAASKSAATKIACDNTLAFICQHIGSAAAVVSGVVWIDSIIKSMQDNLLDEPSEGSWLAVRFEALPLPQPEFWHAVHAAVRNPQKASITTALQSVLDNSELTFARKQSLSTFLADRIAERSSARALQVVQLSLNRLLEKDNEKTAEHAIGIVCSSLHLLNCLERHACRWATVPEIVVDALSLLAPADDTMVFVPARLAHIEYESYLTILQQLRASHCVSGTIAVAIGDVVESLQIRGSLSGNAAADHGPLFAATWELCDVSQCGYSVRGTGPDFVIEIPLKGDVCVTSKGVSDDGTVASVRGIGPGADISLEVERARSALHEIKNRMIASPARWMDEISGCATNLSKVAETMRAPQLERVALNRICEIIDAAVANANATYGITGQVDVIHDEDVGYVDAIMVATILRNLADNASRAASEVNSGTWGIEGVITASEIDVNVWNACSDVAGAKVNVEAGGGRSSSLLGTGIGVSTIKRLAGKLCGRVTYKFDELEVCASVVLPVDAATASLMLVDAR